MSGLLRQRARSNGDEQLIPLINIVFLLLVFFMVAGQIAAPFNRQLELPGVAAGTPIENGPRVLEVDADGAVTLGEQPLPLEDISAAVEGASAVAVRADRRATAAMLQNVLLQVRAAQVNTITLHTRLRTAEL